MRSLLLGALALATPIPALAGDFIDTRLVFIAGDDDFMHNAGVTVPPSQLPDIGGREGYDQFYDLRDSSESGRESRTHLVLHKAADGFLPGLTTEAALVMQLSHDRILSNDPRAIQDDGTFLRIEQKFVDGEKLEVLLLPFDSDRMRLGWLWDVSYGGSRAFPDVIEATPAAKVSWSTANYDFFVGMKTGRMLFSTRDTEDDRKDQIEAHYAFMGGFGIGNKAGGLRLEAQGALIDRGSNPRGPVDGEKVTATGLSARISYVDGLPFDVTTDTRIYSGDPIAAFNAKERYTQSGFRVAAEATWTGQTLEDPDEMGATIREDGLAGAIYGTLASGATRIEARFIGRTLPFLFFDQLGVVTPYQALSEDQDTTPELVASVGFEHHLPEYHLTPGFTVGAQLPASASDVLPDAGNYPPEILTGRHTAVFRRADMFDDTGLMEATFLPPGEEASLVLGARAHVQLDLAEGFAVIAELTALNDKNRVLLEQNTLGVNLVREIDDALTVGGAVMARAEF